MIKKAWLILLVFSITILCNEELYASDSISITHIANCGFLIEIDGHKIIVDGLFKHGHDHYSVPDTITQELLVSNQAPFNEIDLILVSHTHEDHFDKGMVIECMLNNPSVHLLCPQQVIDSINNESAYQTIKPRIIECTPDTFKTQVIHIGNIAIHACRFAHPGERHKDVQNIAYLVSANGKSIFHSADIDPVKIDKYSGVKLNEMNIDVGLLNEDFAKIENAGLAREFINAKYNVAMHLTKDEADVWLVSLKDKPNIFLNPYIFTGTLEKKVFYIER